MIHLNYVDSYQILNFHLFDGKNLELGWLIPIHRISCGAVVLVWWRRCGLINYAYSSCAGLTRDHASCSANARAGNKVLTFTITEKTPTPCLALRAPTNAFTNKNLLRHYILKPPVPYYNCIGVPTACLGASLV